MTSANELVAWRAPKSKSYQGNLYLHSQIPATLTYSPLNSKYWWSSCPQRMTTILVILSVFQIYHTIGFCQLLDILQVSRPWDMVGMDLIESLLTTQCGNKYIFTATDYFTKCPEDFPMLEMSAKAVVSCMLKLFYRPCASSQSKGESLWIRLVIKFKVRKWRFFWYWIITNNFEWFIASFWVSQLHWRDFKANN